MSPKPSHPLRLAKSEDTIRTGICEASPLAPQPPTSGPGRQQEPAGGCRRSWGAPSPQLRNPRRSHVLLRRAPPPPPQSCRSTQRAGGRLLPAWPPAYSISPVCLLGRGSKGQQPSEASARRRWPPGSSAAWDSGLRRRVGNPGPRDNLGRPRPTVCAT